MSRLVTPTDDDIYPCSDGQPMAETGIHVQTLLLLYQALEDFYADRPEVFFAADMFWYWVEGDPTVSAAPDVMIVPDGGGNRDRRSFKSWEAGGAVPAVVVEVSSKKTVKVDLGSKFSQYERLGVREYFLFDPEGIALVPVLQGFRLVGGRYERLLSDDDVLDSELGFGLAAEGKMLRLIDARTGRPILTRRERYEAERAAAAAERQRADAERQRADGLAAEVERLKRLLGERHA